MQFRHLACLISGFAWAVSMNAMAEAPAKRTADQIVNTVCAACHGADGNSADYFAIRNWQLSILNICKNN